MEPTIEQQLKEIIQSSPKEALLPEEKAAMKSHLLHFMQQHPLVTPVAARFAWFGFTKTPAFRVVSLAAMALLVGGGSIAFAAQNALPGDRLYGFKTGVTEKVLAWTMFSEQAKASYDLNLVQLRFQETEQAASENRLNAEASVQVNALLNRHIADAKQRIEHLKQGQTVAEAIQINSDLEASLNANARVLDKIANDRGAVSSAGVKPILKDVKDTVSKVKQSRKSDELDVPLQSSAVLATQVAAKANEADALAEKTSRFLLNRQGQVSVDTYVKGQADLVLVNQDIASGKANVQLENYQDGLINYQDALRTLQEINIYVSNESKLKVKLNQPANDTDEDTMLKQGAGVIHIDNNEVRGVQINNQVKVGGSLLK